MDGYNRAILIGNLTKHPELRYTSSGTAVADIRIAVNRTYMVGNDKREEVAFIPIVVWGKTAENCGEYLLKGSQILVEGRIQTRQYDGRDGGKRYVTEVVADKVQFLRRSKDKSDDGGERETAPASVGPNQAPADDSDVPF